MTIGELVRKVFEGSGIKVTVFAERLGIARQSVYKLFLRESIETELLAKICQILSYDFFRHFRWDPERGEVVFLEKPQETFGDSSQRISLLQMRLDGEQKRVRQLEKRIQDKERIIELLKGNG